MINRAYIQHFTTKMKPNKVYLLLGARRIGKTFLLKQLINEFSGKTMYLNAEDMKNQQLLADRSVSNYKQLLNGIDLFIIDEAQVIPDIGLILKLIVDEIHDIRIIASGSSAFDIMNLSGEPLTGRSFKYLMFAPAQMEISTTENRIETRQNLDERLIFGSYPELFQLETSADRENYLINLVHSYLLKDILTIDGLRSASKIMDLLKLIAFQIGKEVSYHEIGQQLGMSKNTVEKYLDLLTKVFVVFNLGGYSKNLRKEISKGNKWYFMDNGIRNAIISNFSPVALRSDMGELWENYIISERIKRNNYLNVNASYYHWRTYDQQEIDLIEEYAGKTFAYEFKWRKTKSKTPVAWANNYPNAPYEVISIDNYLNFIL